MRSARRSVRRIPHDATRNDASLVLAVARPHLAAVAARRPTVTTMPGRKNRTENNPFSFSFSITPVTMIGAHDSRYFSGQEPEEEHRDRVVDVRSENDGNGVPGNRDLSAITGRSR